TWHLVGHLQTNKARAALDLFDTIQSVDSVRLAKRISDLADHPVPVFLEVQFARAPDRFGFEPDGLGAAIAEIQELPNLEIAGLIHFIDQLFQILSLAIVCRALLSWFPVRPGNPFYPLAVILNQVTEPILGPLRRIIPTIGMIDISPIVALLLLNAMQAMLEA